MKFSLLRKERAVGLDVGNGAVKALALERRRSEVVVVRRGVAPVETGDAADLSRAIHAALADAGADGEPVIAAVGGPDVVIRQLSLPPVPKARILPALELQHRELGLLPPREAVMDAQILRKSRKDVAANEILSVSVPRPRLEERMRFARYPRRDVFQKLGHFFSVGPCRHRGVLCSAQRLTMAETSSVLRTKATASGACGVW